MKKVNILATDENVEEIRERAIEISEFKDRSLLKTPLSPTGDLPITHWLCSSVISDDLYEKILSLQDLSEIQTGSKSKFMKSKGLKKVKFKK